MKILLYSTLTLLFTAFSFIAQAGDSQGKIVIVHLSGFDDATVATPVGGNNALTLGEQRKEVFERAAFIWSNILDLDYDITVEVNFTPLTCSSGSATLGYAGPNRVAKRSNVWYATAQSNQIDAADTSGANNDIYADFNSSIDEGCYSASPNGWYYGLDNIEPADQEMLLDVVLHEIGHGLGHLSFVDGPTGALYHSGDGNGVIDSYSRFLKDAATGKNWSSMTDTERLASNHNSQLIWDGTLGNTLANTTLTGGLINNSIQMHAPSTYSSGSSVSHISTAAAPNQLMEPYNTDDGVHPMLEVQMFKDMGYKLKEDLVGKNNPVAADYELDVEINGSVNLAVLSHVTDLDSGDTIALYTFTALPSNGSLDDNFSASAVYSPTTGYSGSDTITYQVYDSFMQLSNEGTISINVIPADATPVASDDVATLDEDHTGYTINVLVNDTDDNSVDSSTLAITTVPTNGSASVVTGKIVYTPNNNYFGSDTLEYSVKDNTGQTSNNASVIITVNNIDDSPVINADSFTVSEDSNGNNLDLIANDSDIDSTLNNSQVVIIALPLHGSVNVNGSGVSYTPAANFYGSDGFSYRLDVDGGSSNSEIVSLVIDNLNDAPISSADSFSITGNTSTDLDVLANDSDIDNDNSDLSIVIESQPNNGSIILSNSNIRYTPDNNYAGADSFSYSLKDPGNLDSNASTVSLTVSHINLPEAIADHFVFNEGISDAVLNLTSNDSFSNSITNIQITRQPEHGTISVNGLVVSFTAIENAFGQSDFSYRITEDSGLQSLVVMSSIMLINKNDAPETHDDTLTVVSGVNSFVNILANDVDENLDDVTIHISAQPNHGSLEVINGKIYYSLTDLIQTQDSFSYSLEDKDGLSSNQSNVSLTISNQLPIAIASDDEFTVKVDTRKTLTVLSNDTLYSDSFSLTITQNPTYGSATLQGSSIIYDADSTTTQDSFSYTITDEQGQTSPPATVSIELSSRSPLVVFNDYIELDANDEIMINVTDNDEFEQIQSLQLHTDDCLGTVNKQADNQLNYQAGNSDDSFVYCLTDDAENTQCAQVYISIRSNINDDSDEQNQPPALTDNDVSEAVTAKSEGGSIFYLLTLIVMLWPRLQHAKKGSCHE